MKKNLRGKIREYIQSEEGKVGAKSPLTLGVVTGGILLAQAVIEPPSAEADGRICFDPDHGDCPPGFFCRDFIWDHRVQEHYGTCM